ncbi:AP-2 complex subunit alpha [Smittium mucronatum]|uniref:AP-2 complex subunit alpha n=1 Tax=Smittium mucronatum TaxID=133383 RepID=A0A1R0H7C6_9FUNG|nr:AP-2 complex subunit alpha [Smittium mucronatum]
MIGNTLNILESFISSRDANIRYLGLEALTHLASKFDDLSFYYRNKDIFYTALFTRDESIQARALDLLFTICTVENAKEIVEKLLKMPNQVNSTLRSEVTSKIALLTEKYATEYTWYVDVMFELLSMEDSSLENDVWQRVVQVILNNEGLQLYAVRLSFNKLKTSDSSDISAKVYVYLVGQLGYLIASEPQCSPSDLLASINNFLKTGNAEVRIMSSTAVTKLFSKFREIRQECITTLKESLDFPDLEFQQRVSEYIAVAELEDEELIREIFDTSLIGKNFESTLMTKMLSRKDSRLGDRRTWVPGSKFLPDKSNVSPKGLAINAHKNPGDSSMSTSEKFFTQSQGLDNIANSGTVSSVANDYDYLLWNNSGILHEDSELSTKVKLSFNPPYCNLTLLVLNKKDFQLNNFSISIIDPQTGESPNSSNGLQLLSSSFEEINSGLTLVPLVEMDFDFKFVCNEFFEIVPRFKISFSYFTNSETIERSVLIPAPISFLRFIEKVKLDKDDFFSRWKQLQGPPYQAQVVFAPVLNSWTKYKEAPLIKSQIKGLISKTVKQNHNPSFDKGYSEFNPLENSPSSGPSSSNPSNPDPNYSSNNPSPQPVESALMDMNSSYINLLFSSLGFYNVPSADPDPNNFVGVGIATTAKRGRFGTLLRYEFDRNNKMCQVIVRATNSEISSLLLKEIKRLLSA